ncbi:MAG: beta-ketoacyl synthase chain length factor [Steroidobacteraceae bacterium]
MTVLSAHIDGIAVLGPGLASWSATESILAGRAPYVPARTILPAATALPAAERRRAGRVVQLVIATGLDAAEGAGLDPATLVSVFASSGGDGDNCHELCQALASPERQVSPTRFHNSVHNAPAGYWSIATRAMTSSTSICAYDRSFSAGLLEAMVQVATIRQPVLLLAYDVDYPFPLRAVRRIPDAFGLALVLVPARTGRSIVQLTMQLCDAMQEACEPSDLESLRIAIPAARSLSLLRLIARRERRTIGFEHLGSTSLSAAISPC